MVKAAPRLVSSEIAEIEVVRAARSRRGEVAEARAWSLLENIHLIELDAEVRRVAARLDPLTLRPSGAIHVATALTLEGPDLVFVGYDRRLQAAAAAAGLAVDSPGA